MRTVICQTLLKPCGGMRMGTVICQTLLEKCGGSLSHAHAQCTLLTVCQTLFFRNMWWHAHVHCYHGACALLSVSTRIPQRYFRRHLLLIKPKFTAHQPSPPFPPPKYQLHRRCGYTNIPGDFFKTSLYPHAAEYRFGLVLSKRKAYFYAWRKQQNIAIYI